MTTPNNIFYLAGGGRGRCVQLRAWMVGWGGGPAFGYFVLGGSSLVELLVFVVGVGLRGSGVCG